MILLSCSVSSLSAMLSRSGNLLCNVAGSVPKSVASSARLLLPRVATAIHNKKRNNFAANHRIDTFKTPMRALAVLPGQNKQSQKNEEANRELSPEEYDKLVTLTKLICHSNIDYVNVFKQDENNLKIAVSTPGETIKYYLINMHENKAYEMLNEHALDTVLERIESKIDRVKIRSDATYALIVFLSVGLPLMRLISY